MENKEPEPLGLGTPVYAPELKMYSCKYTENETIIDLVEWKNDRLEFKVSDENTSAALDMLNERLHELAAENAGFKSELETLRAERMSDQVRCDIINVIEWVSVLNEGDSLPKHIIDLAAHLNSIPSENISRPVPPSQEITASDYEEVIADHKRLVRELDVSLNGDGAAKQASLCDVVSQVAQLVREKGSPLFQPSPAVAVPDLKACIDEISEVNDRVEYVGKRGRITLLTKRALNMISTPTPPSAEQKCTCQDAYDAWQYAEGARCNYCAANGDKPSGMYTQSVEQPDSTALSEHVFIVDHCGTTFGIYPKDKTTIVGTQAKRELMPKGTKLYLHPPSKHKHQRITEQDAREIAKSFLLHRLPNYLMDRDKAFNDWAAADLIEVLAKLNEHREPEYKARLSEAVAIIQEARNLLDANLPSFSISEWLNSADKAIAQCEGKGDV